jgi:glycolate oxidase FAD binding subunit
VQPALLEKIRGIVGSEYVLAGVECSSYALEGRTPEAAAFPGSVQEVSALLTLASEEGIAVMPWGGGTTISVGATATKLGIVLGLRRLNRLLEHEPGDLTATAQAGMTLEAFQRALGTGGQWLSLDPPFGERATLGGILACNASGPRRHLYGTARDLLIGLTVVSADGAVVRGGGKVVKNVAGYDLPKLYIGSFGTLGVIVEATLKLRPLPEEDRLILARFEEFKDCAQAARLVLTSDLIPSAMDLLDAGALRGLRLAGGPGAGGALLLGFDGVREQVEWQCEEAKRVLAGAGPVEHRLLEGQVREETWRVVREVGWRLSGDPGAVLKLAVLPTRVCEVIEQSREAARRNGLNAAFAAHAAVGVVTAVLAAGGESPRSLVATLREWRELVRTAGGQAVLERAPLAVKEQVEVWEAPGPAFRIMERIKTQLDPKGILNPGRFVGGI